MITKEKQNGTVKRMVTKKAQEVKPTAKNVEAKAPSPAKKQALEEKPKTEEVKVTTPVIETKVKTLEERLSSFEKLKGMTSQRERLATTLDELNKFKYQNADSSVFHLKDENGKEFKTTNNNLIQLVTDMLQGTLTTRKAEIEKSILDFDM